MQDDVSFNNSYLFIDHLSKAWVLIAWFSLGVLSEATVLVFFVLLINIHTSKNKNKNDFIGGETITGDPVIYRLWPTNKDRNKYLT